jgi:hypothetical protein
MRKILEIGGFAAAAVLIVFGIAVIVIGVQGRNTVHTSLQQEHIVGSDDMTPAQIKLDAAEAGLPASTTLPTVDIAGQEIDTGTEARAFASYIRIHALEASGGLTYSQLPRFETADGKGTSDAALALQADGKPVANQARATWVTATALSTALNTSYMAESLSLFAIVVGIALLLCGVGFGILAASGALRHVEPAARAADARPPTSATPAVPAV